MINVRSRRAQPSLLGQPSVSTAAPAESEFEGIYRATYPRLLAFVTAMLRDPSAAEDCVQETFLRAYRGWSSWRGDAPVEAWLHRIALNVARSYCRWSRLRQLGETVRRLGPPPEVNSAEPGLRGELLEGLRRLPPDQAAVIMLRHHHGFSNREIAHVLKVPESTVASRLATAKERLRKYLGVTDASGRRKVSPLL